MTDSESFLTPHEDDIVHKHLEGQDAWAQKAIKLARTIYLLQDPNLDQDKFVQIKSMSKELLPKRVVMDTWGHEHEEL